MSACRDGEELDSQGDASSQPDTISIASRTSQNTLDSDKVGKNHTHAHTQTHQKPPENPSKIHRTKLTDCAEEIARKTQCEVASSSADQTKRPKFLMINCRTLPFPLCVEHTSRL